MKAIIGMIAFCCCVLVSTAYSQVEGRVDIGYAWIDIDVLESGKTVDKMHVNSVRGDATIALYKGFCVKPGFTVGWGDGNVQNVTLALGQYIPLGEYCSIMDKFSILPHVGIGYGRIHTHIDIEEFGLFHLKEQFHSISPFIGIDLNFKITEKFMVFGIVQYVWSRTHTKIGDFPKDKSHSEGFNYALVLEYNFYKSWCITLAGGYNTSLTKEKHGFRIKGAKLGLAYYF